MTVAQKLSVARRRVREVVERGIVTHAARRALSLVPGANVFRMFIVVLREPRPSPEAQLAAKNHDFHFATLEELQRLLADPESHIAERDIVSFQRGNRCLLQYDGEALVGYTWISDSSLIDVNWGLHINLPDDMLYNYNGFTTKAYRGTAFQALRHLKVLELTHAQGKRRLIGYVDHLNYASLRGVAKSGYEQVGVIWGVERNGKIRFSVQLNADSWSTATRAGPLQR